MGLEVFMGLVFSTVLSGFGYLLVRKDTEDKEWRERMEKKVDDIPKNIMLELGNYVQAEAHNLDITKVNASIASVGRDVSDIDKRVKWVESQLGLRRAG